MDQLVDTEPAAVRQPERLRDRRWLLAGLGMAVTCLFILPAAGALYAGHHLVSNLDRLDGVFAGLSDRDRPAVVAAGATNILVVATDRGADAAIASAAPADLARETGRSDTLMLFHIDADRRAASIVSIPRDTMVAIPGHGTGRISTGFSLGGPSLAIGSVEHLTGVRVDHLAIIDWSRFGALVDAVGGIDVDVSEDVRDPSTGVTWTTGRHHVDGVSAVGFIRQGASLPRGDLDRIARQHVVLRALMADALEQEMRKDPLRLYRFLDTVTEHLALDSGWSVTDMARLVFSMRDFRSANLSYLTTPVDAVGDLPGDGTYWPDDQAHGLWRSLAEDRVGDWETQHPHAVTPWVVR